MRSLLSFQSTRELLLQVASRYREASARQKRVMLDEFVAATGYARKYAIRLLGQRMPVRAGPIVRPRPRRYGPAVLEALTVAWAAANYVCARRLVPFLPDLVTALEHHGHLSLTDPARAERLWLALAVATFWVISIGEAAEQDLTRPVIGALTPGPQRPRQMRLFRLGLLTLLVAAITAQPLPLPGPLSTDAWPGDAMLAPPVHSTTAHVA